MPTPKANANTYEFKYDGDFKSLDALTVLHSQINFVTVLKEIKDYRFPEVQLDIKIKGVIFRTFYFGYNVIAVDEDYGDIIAYGEFTYKWLYQSFTIDFTANFAIRNEEIRLVKLSYVDNNGQRDSKKF